MRKEEEGHSADAQNVLLGIAFGGVVAVAVALVGLAIASLLIMQGMLEEKWMRLLPAFAGFVGCLVGGYLANRKVRHAQLWVGLGVGGLFCIVLLVIGLLFFDSFSPNIAHVPYGVGALIGGAVSGFFVRKPKKKRRK